MTEIDNKSLSLWEALHRKWYNTIQSINLDGTLVDDANISELLDIEKEIWSLILEFKEADVELPESMKRFKPYIKLYEETIANNHRTIYRYHLEKLLQSIQFLQHCHNLFLLQK